MKILIFGGTGAMGEPLAELLANQRHSVYVTSRSKREYANKNLHGIVGNAHDMNFVREVMKDEFDVLIDFMNYKLSEFNERVEFLLNSTGQYVFLSSCRVYAESFDPITESTPRLLDVCKDKEYLRTEEYALAKAREENLLYEAKRKNWTIVRPSVTYNSKRLQLGCYELEDWLYRSFHGRPVVFFDDLADKLTPMTYGDDVAKGISYLLGNPEAYGEIVQIVTPESRKWSEILEIYQRTLAGFGLELKIIMYPHAEMFENAMGRKWRLKYNRIYNRVFDSSKMNFLSKGKLIYTPMEEGLEKSLFEFLSGGGYREEMRINPRNEGNMDKLLRIYSRLSEFKGWKGKTKYVLARYTSYYGL